MKKQIILVHGGTTFDKYEDFWHFLENFTPSLEHLKKKKWRESLQERLGSEFDVVSLKMPNKMNSNYDEWKVYFEKFIALFEEEVVLVGHSLGSLFLAKYLSENNFAKKIKATFLIAPPFDDEKGESLGNFKMTKGLDNFARQAGQIFIYYSEDDKVILPEDALKYKTHLPNAKVVVFQDRGHLSQEELPELIEDIKKIYS